MAYLPKVELPYLQGEPGLMEYAVDGWFGCRVEEHDPLVAMTAGVAVSIHLVEVALGESVVQSGGIQNLVLRVYQETFALGIGKDEIDFHVELTEYPSQRALRFDIIESPLVAKFYAILVTPQEPGNELLEERVHVEDEGQLL